MSRIRSVHPDQWVDEEFVGCSPLARLLALGLRNYSDDNGVFEWKIMKIKMQVLPGDNCDIKKLLHELLESNQVVKYEVEGSVYGLIRNFSRFQKPRKPNSRYPLPVNNNDLFQNKGELNRFMYGTSTPLVPNQYGTSTEPVRNRYTPEKEKERE